MLCGQVRPAARPRRRAGPARSGRHRRHHVTRSGGREERHQDDPHRHVRRWRSCRARTYREPCASGWRHHRVDLQRRAASFRQTTRAAERDGPQGPPSGGPFESGQSRRRAHDKQREDRRPVNESGAAVPGGEVPTSSIAPSRRWSKSARKRSSCCRTRCSVCSGRGSQSLREKSRLPSMHGVRELVEAGA